MDWWLLSFFIGAILSLFLPIVPEIFILLLIFSLAITLFSFKRTRSSSGLFFGMAWLLFNGFQYDNTWAANQLDDIELSKKSQLVSGEIVTIPTIKKGDYRFNFLIKKLNGNKLTKPFIIRLRWTMKRNRKNKEYNNTKSNKQSLLFKLAQGQSYQLKVKFKPAHGFANPASFSYQTWLREKKIVATGYVKSSKDNVLLQSKANLRQSLYQQYLAVLPEHSLAPLLLALSFAQRSEISAETWQVLRATGTQHLIAISGLHLGLVASGSFIFFLFIVRIMPLDKILPKTIVQYLLQYNLRYFVLLLSLSVTVFYGYLADFTLPTTRALTMLMLYWLMRLLAIKLTLMRWLLITLFLLVLMAPFSLFSSSFWLSVYAVVVIFLTLWRFSHTLAHPVKFWRIVKALLIIQLSLTLFLMPLTAFFYHQLSLVSLFANLVAVPVMSFIIIPLCLLSLIILVVLDLFPFSEIAATAVMQLALHVLQPLWHYLTWLSESKFALVPLSLFQSQFLVGVVFIIAMGCFLSSTFFRIKTFKLKWLFIKLSWIKEKQWQKGIGGFILMVLPLLIYSTNSTSLTTVTSDKKRNWQVNILDVGQGLAIIIQQGGHAILYDTGAAYPSGFNLVEAVVLPYLQYHGINKLDKVIISHSDNDHAGGLSILKDKIVIEQFMVNDIDIRENTDSFCLSNQSFNWQGLKFQQLWPTSKKGKNNDDSCVIRVSDGKYSVLLTGDISKKVEALLITKQGNKLLRLKSDVLIAAHHGSKTSSTTEFIKAVSPNAVVFSAGFLNRWQMPVPSVKSRFIEQGIVIHSTSEHGMINIDIDKQQLNIYQYRTVYSPYWFSN